MQIYNGHQCNIYKVFFEVKCPVKLLLHLFLLSDHPSLAFHCLVFVWRAEVFGPSHSSASRWQPWPPQQTLTMLKSLSSTAASTPASNCLMKSLTTTTARPDSLSARALKLLQVSRLRRHKKMDTCGLDIQRPTNVQMHIQTYRQLNPILSCPPDQPGSFAHTQHASVWLSWTAALPVCAHSLDLCNNCRSLSFLAHLWGLLLSETAGFK